MKLLRNYLPVGALLLGGVLRNATGMQVFFWLGVLGCVGIFGLGRGEEFRARREQREQNKNK